MSPLSANNFRLPGTRKARAHRARLAGRTGITLSVMLVATLLPTQAWAAPPNNHSGVELPGLQQDLKAKLDTVEAGKLEDWANPVPAPPAYEPSPSKVTPPAAATASVALVPTMGDKEFVQVGSLPVQLGKASPTESQPAPPAPSGTWQVAVEERAVVEAANVDGAIIKVTPPADSSTPINVKLDYKQFEDLYGTEWATRLKIRLLPECYLTTPEDPDCWISKDVPSTNLPEEGSVVATVDPATAPGQGLRTMAVGGAASMALVASDGGAGAGGTYKATSLAPSGSWTAGGSGGGFSWTYPLTVPAPPAGPAPKIAFSYSSQAVDGKTSVANSQASWVGDGWDYEPGFIERRYRSCSDDLGTTGGTPNNKNEIDKKKGDLCWADDNVVMSFGGSTTELVHDAKSGKWIPSSDDGSRVERIIDSALANGAKDGEYWVVTTREGTRYFFGRHDVDGAGGSRPVTNSVLTVPVFGNHPGEPCYQQAFANSSCSDEPQTAWRWNLDYAEDVHGNAMVIDWAKETNRYAKNGKATEAVTYTRAGYPTQITYGLRSGNLSGAPAAKVEFTVEERCIKEGPISCSETEFESKSHENGHPWWDTPASLHCKTGATCDTGSPTFWSRKRLTAVTTLGQRTEGSTALSLVDRWNLTQSFPKQRTDTSPPLWLDSIIRTGYGTKKDSAGNQLHAALPAVTFRANDVDMPNRVSEGADPVTGRPDATPDFDRLRVETIRTETGGDIYVDYSAPCPVGGAHPKPEENTTRCFPVHWSPDSELKTPPLAWFNKYVVESITEKDRVARRPDVTTTYTYEGGAAWAKDADEFSKPELRTYSQWRGYASVVTKRGITANAGKADSTEQSQTRTRYFRGMSGDAGRPQITIKDSTGTELLGEDLLHYQGQSAETITYTKAGGTPVARTLTWPWSEKTGERPRAGTTTLYAHRSGTSRTDKIQWISDGTTRTLRTRNTFDKTYDSTFDPSYGLIQAVQSEVVTPNGTGGWKSSDQTCASTTYVHNTGKHLIGLVSGIRTTAGDCSQKTTGALLSDTRTSYDALNAFGTAPVKGLAYQVDTNDAAGTGWITTARSEYDELGRPTKVLDAASNPLTTSYSPATGPAFAVTSTNALGHTSTTKSDPGRGVPLEDTDANGRKVTTAYDELGRTTAVWTPSQKPATDKAAHTFAYQIKEHEEPAVTSAVLQDDGTYTESIAIYDGLLRPRQTQTEALGGGKLITDTLYSENGTVSQTNSAYLAEGKPEKKLFVPDSMTAVRNSTQTAYDGLGRPVRTTTLHDGIAKQSTTTAYGGDWTLTRTGMNDTGATPLPGSRAVKTFTDALGRTSLVQHYTATDLTTSNSTTYTYDLRNKLSKVTDAANNNWTYAYDARGRMTSSSDPDMGTSTFTYNTLDQQTSVTDTGGYAQHMKYDVLGRKTEVRADSATGTLISSWTYDTLPGGKGLPVASSRPWGGKLYTSEVTGYDTESRPTGSKITVPDVAGTTGLAGTYTYSTTYTATGKVQSTTVPATPGGLAAEKLITRYNADGMPQTMSGLDWYTSDTIYSPYGEVLRTESGSAPNRVWTSKSYNPNTGRIAEATGHRETRTTHVSAPTNLVSAVAYIYDAVGNPTSITETQPATDDQSPPRVDRQCFTYDAMGQLTKAWTGKTAACTGPTLTDVTPDGDGYWQEYQFDAIGNRTKLTDKDLTSATFDDVTTYTYGVEVAGGAQPPVKKQPHALTKVNKTTKTAGSTVNSESTYTYTAQGNIRTRKIGGDTQSLEWNRLNQLVKATSPGIGAVAVTGLSGKCLDVENGNTAAGTPAQVTSCNETKPQQWRLTDETVQALGKCLTAEDTAEGGRARLNTCDGSPRQKFTYRAEDKTLFNPATGECVTVPNNNAIDGNDLHIYTCVAGAEAQQWAFANATTYLYDASGSRLIEETGSSRTLYLGEAEITVDKAGQAIDAVRYYSGPGATTVRRTNGKNTGHTLTALLTDHHNTATTSVDLAAGQAMTRRKSDPYGNPRGTQPANWPGSRTFLGTGNDDNTTGLTHIGAREYEPATGRFISVDPIIDITDPLQMNGYTYSRGNPITNSDPTGLKDDNCAHNPRCTANGGTVVEQGSYNYVAPPPQAPSKGNAGGKGKDCGFFSKCNLNKGLKAAGDFWNENKVAIVSIGTEIVVGVTCVAAAGAGAAATGGAGIALVAGCGAIAGAAGAAAANWMTPNADHSTVGILKEMGNGALWGAAGGTAGAAATPLIKAGAKALGAGAGKLVSKLKANGGSCPVPNSFTAGTLVLMADGTYEPIDELEPGDQVLAANPTTGETVPKDVTATILGNGAKDLVEITVDTGNDETGSAPDIITATDKHPFWVTDLNAWIDATDLQPGQSLLTSTGTHVQIKTVTHWTANTTVHNLTVADLHTYYVLAGASPVLVHNCGGSKLKDGEQYVYRAVKDDEMKQLLNTRRFQNPRGIESKYFSSTPEGAALYARSAHATFPDEGAYTLVRGVIRTEHIPAESRIEHLADGGGGIDAFALWEDSMSTIGRVRILPSMPIP